MNSSSMSPRTAMWMWPAGWRQKDERTGELPEAPSRPGICPAPCGWVATESYYVTGLRQHFEFLAEMD